MAISIEEARRRQSAVTVDQHDLEDAIKRLSGLSPLEYDQQRQAEAKRLGVRATTLDAQVKARRPKQESDNGLGLFEPEPWPEPVDGADLLDEVAGSIRRYVVMPDHAAEAAALWVTHCHAFECWQHTPRLSVMAPEKGCGKSTLLDVLSFLTPRAVKTENISTAVMFRLMDAHKPTLLIDECDTFLSGRTADEDLRGALNAGHAKGGCHLRCEGDAHDVKAFKTFGPAALAGIGNLPGTLADRSISIVLQKRSPDEYVQDFRSDRAGHLRDTASKVARWALDNEKIFRKTEPRLPSGIYNRAADNWRPLLSVADAAGGAWPELARRAAVALARGGEDAESNRVKLLAALRDIFDTIGDDRIASKELTARLHDMEDSPWPEYGFGGKPITPVQVARLLKPFGIAPGPQRIGGVVTKGYKLNMVMQGAFARYLPPRAVTQLQAKGTADFSDPRAVTPSEPVTGENSEKARVSAACDRVTDQTESEGAVSPDDWSSYAD